MHVQFLHDIRPMNIRRTRADMQLCGDFLRGVPLPDQLENLPFAGSQAGE